MKDLNSLSKEELIALLNKKSEEIEDFRNELLSTKDELSDTKEELKLSREESESLRVKNRSLQEQVNELIKKYEDKTQLIKKVIIDAYVPKSERIGKYKDVINELEQKGKKSSRRSPYKTIVSDLKKLNVDNVVTIDYDFKLNGVDKDKVKSFGKDETYKIEAKPMSIEIVKVERLKYKDKNKIYTPLSEDLFPHTLLTPSLAAHILSIKYYLGVPFYRYGSYLNALGINVSNDNVYNWAAMAIDLLNPIYDAILNKLINTQVKVIHIDETTLPIVDEEKAKCYMFAYASSVWEVPIIVYDFSIKRTIAHTKGILKGYDGYIITDGYSAYNGLKEDNIKIQRCFTHLRRKLYEVIKTYQIDEAKKTSSFKMIEIISELYMYEGKFKSDKLKPSQIKEERNKPYYLDILNRLDQAMCEEKENKNASELSKKAVNYYFNQKNDLLTFLDDGYLVIDNNRVERDAIKPFVINRKNFLFCKNEEGAERTAKIFTIIQTARANGLKIEQYLKYTIENINKEDVGDLLPWSPNLPKELKITVEDL